MSLYLPHIKSLIERTLKEVGLYSESAVNLLLGTCAQESVFGTYLVQLGNGPAKGFFQIEPGTEKDIWDNYIIYNADVYEKMQLMFGAECSNPDRCEYDIRYSIVIARLKYRRDRAPLPQSNDVKAMAKYWKRVYNTFKGNGTIEEFISNYEEFILQPNK